MWESEEAGQRFDEARMAPALADVGAQRPAPETWQLHNLLVRG